MILLWRKCDTQTQNGTMNRFLYLEIVSFKIEEFFAVNDGDHYGGLGSDPVDIYIQQCQHLKEHTGIRLPWRPRYHQLVGRSVLAGGQRSPWWGWMHPAARLSRRAGSKPARASDFTINHCRVQENQPISVWVIKSQRWLLFVILFGIGLGRQNVTLCSYFSLVEDRKLLSKSSIKRVAVMIIGSY